MNWSTAGADGFGTLVDSSGKSERHVQAMTP